MEKENQNFLEVQNLSVIIKERFLVKNVSFSMKKGACYGIVGEQKSGKTSLIKAISGSLPISPGQVFIDGQDIFLNKKVLRRVSTCFDPPVFFKYQTVFENMKYLSHLSESYDKVKIMRALNKFNLAHKARTRVKNLSYYERKLMGLAVGLVTNPDLLLIDEPFKNLPEKHLNLVYDTLNQFRKEGKTLIITSENLEGVEKFCEKIIFVEGRQIKDILENKQIFKFTDDKDYAFVKVKYPHYIGKLLSDEFGLRVKLLDKRIIFEADEDKVAEIVHFLTKKRLAVYRAGYLNRSAEKVLAGLTPFFKEEK